MKLENYTYQQSSFIRYFVLIYIMLILAISIFIYFGDSEIPKFLIFMNIPVAVLILASFYKKNYIVVKDNVIEVYNSFKPREIKLENIKYVEPVGGSTWVIKLNNKQKTNLSKFRVAKADQEQFKKQMKALQSHFKNSN